MASFNMEEFLGDGVLKSLLPTLVDAGWDDVPTLKMMSSEDMDLMKMSQKQKNALEIRSYLHDRSLMQYANRLESSERSLAELLSFNKLILSSQYGMTRGHITRFTDRENASSISLPSSHNLTARQTSVSYAGKSQNDNSLMASRNMRNARSSLRGSKNEMHIEQSAVDYKIKDGYTFKGIVAAESAEPRLCGWIKPPPIVDDVAPYFSIENASVQKLAPEYKAGMERLVTTTAPPMKASALWHNKPTILLCIRRPGCIMCRAEAHQLYARKPIFDTLGVQLIAVLHEQIESEIKDFWPRYWGGAVIIDINMDLFKALGGGQLLEEKFISGFLFNPRAIANFKRAKNTGLEYNFKGAGEIKGGLFIIGSGKSGIAYQFIERNFGDWAPIAEVVEVCNRIQKNLPIQGVRT